MSFYKKVTDRKERQKLHAAKRARERYGETPNIDRINKMIRTKQSKFVRKYSNRLSVHMVVYEGVEYKLVYDKVRQTVTTFLKHEMA